MSDDEVLTEGAENPPPCEHHWVSYGQGSRLLPWIIRCDMCGAFDISEMERAAETLIFAREQAVAREALDGLADEATRTAADENVQRDDRWADDARFIARCATEYREAHYPTEEA